MIFYIPTGANGAKVLFPDTDERVSEDSTQAKIPVQVGGDIEDAGNFTVIVTPLTVARYNAHPDIYGTICDSVIAEGINTAEGQYKHLSTVYDGNMTY